MIYLQANNDVAIITIDNIKETTDLKYVVYAFRQLTGVDPISLSEQFYTFEINNIKINVGCEDIETDENVFIKGSVMAKDVENKIAVVEFENIIGFLYDNMDYLNFKSNDLFI